MAILHGGQLSRVAKEFGIPEQQWLDLSTGIAPFSYPIPDIPSKIWQDLPTISEGLIEAAKVYYQAEYCWPVAGSQQLIEKLPQLWNAEKKHNKQHNKEHNNQHNKQSITLHAYLPKVGYKEHQQAWMKAGYQLHFYQAELPNNIEKNSVVVVINPNNPLTDKFNVKQLTSLQKHCAAQHALLIIDEAFADIFSPEFSFVPHLYNANSEVNCSKNEVASSNETAASEQTDNVIVLRSFGKFFGLAGLRIGFACSSKKWCDVIQESIGPWSINGPALYIAEKALKDKYWQTQQTLKLVSQSEAMQSLFTQYLPNSRIQANALFITVFVENAVELYQQLCKVAVYVRLTDERDALRIGIADDKQLNQFTIILASLIQ